MTWVRDWWLAWPMRWAVARVVCLKKGLTAKDATDLRPTTIVLRVYNFWSAYRSSLGITTYISARFPPPTAIAGTCHFRTCFASGGFVGWWKTTIDSHLRSFDLETETRGVSEPLRYFALKQMTKVRYGQRLQKVVAECSDVFFLTNKPLRSDWKEESWSLTCKIRWSKSWRKWFLFSNYFIVFFQFCEVYFTVLSCGRKTSRLRHSPWTPKNHPKWGTFHLRTAFHRLCIILRVCSWWKTFVFLNFD